MMFKNNKFKSLFSPSQNEILKAKKVFLEKFDQAFVTNREEERIFVMQHVLRYSFVFIVLLVVIGSGAMIYADRTDVPFNHPLYSLKKANENIQVQIASAADAPQLYNKLAQRRITEMKAIQDDQDEDDQAKAENIKALSLELEQEIDNALLKLDEVKGEKSNSGQEKTKLCASIANLIENHKKIIAEYENKADFNEDYSSFNKFCAK